MSVRTLQHWIEDEQREAREVTKEAIRAGRGLLEAMSDQDLVAFADEGERHDAVDGHCLRCVAWFIWVGRTDRNDWMIP